MTHKQKLSAQASGFTLVEIIAVLAILAILASAIAPNIASALKRARSDAEDVSLANIGKLISESVIRTHSIPGSATWADSVAVLSDLPKTQITTNNDNFPRVFVVDPNWKPAPPPAAGWAQTPAASWAISTAPTNCRILIISGTQQDLIPSCAGLTTAEFDNIWNLQGGPAACQPGNDVRVGRVNLTSLFFPVTIHAMAAGSFSLDWKPGSPVQLFGVGLKTFYVVSGTRLSLMDAIGTTLKTDLVVNQNLSASWDGAAWTVN